MDKSAILHIPMSQYAYGVDETHVTIRLRAKRDDIDRCTLYFGDRACRQTPVIFSEQEMEKVYSTSLYDYFEVTLENPYKRLCYYFNLRSGDEQIYYYGDCFCRGLVDDRSEYFQLPFNHRADIVNPPTWAKDAVIYNIFPDSFATDKEYISEQESSADFNGIEVKGKLGGTIRGIKNNVSYLKDLGINAIYINPIFAAGEYHKYDLVDYYHVDPCFGSNEEFKQLVETFHENGLKVIIDGVFNHCGWKFFAFEDVVQNGEDSRYKDWFYGLKYPVIRPEDPEEYPTYECFGYERMMPKLDLDNPETAEYFINVGKYWVKEFDIDGWRLDVASEINDGFWRAFYKAVKSEKNDAIIIGEVWETACHWLDGTIFDSAMNYDFRKHCRRFFAEESIDSEEFNNRVVDMITRYRKQTVYSQLNVLDTHDVSRFLSLCDGDLDRYKLAVIFQMTFPGMPSIFYGDEKGIQGILEKDYRHPMIWDGKRDELFLFYRALIELRKAEEVLRAGDFRTLSAENGSKLYAYERMLGNEKIVIYLNMSEKKMSIDAEPDNVLLEKGLAGKELEGKGFVIFKSRG
ncbi:glycoside hydrolase family 13 protein [Butyrivibrio sp. WCE2006]|uniref:glycoside hydrolase family 13 protein n=1 Tax=Butyrivibrio sp. WCE2006 TaxID=1410611 RepID=UPI0005D2B387|nr:glycoside hydrolase family 13 protein [Butyrivibrio sp. WCE2006]